MKRIISMLIIVIALTGCAVPAKTTQTVVKPVLQQPTAVVTDQPAPLGTIVATEVNQPTELSTATEAAPLSTETAAGTINPLTGLPVEEPDLLNLPPALVSISNFPVSARPQAGLSLSPWVFELSIGEGMTRFLAMFYGKYLSGTSGILDTTEVGPIRSGRLPYEDIRKLYNGFIVMAGAYSGVAANLQDANNVFGKNADNINSASVDLKKLEDIARANTTGSAPQLGGMVYSNTIPGDGKVADKLWVFYSTRNQVQWTYDTAQGAYLRWQDRADGTGEFVPATDKLTDQQLAFSNVVVMVINHKAHAETLIELDMLYTSGKAFLFRDGKVYPLKWSTMPDAEEKASGKLKPIKWLDAEGKPFAFKPGNTFVEIVTPATMVEELEPGFWKARFFAPIPEKK